MNINTNNNINTNINTNAIININTNTTTRTSPTVPFPHPPHCVNPHSVKPERERAVAENSRCKALCNVLVGPKKMRKR